MFFCTLTRFLWKAIKSLALFAVVVGVFVGALILVLSLSATAQQAIVWVSYGFTGVFIVAVLGHAVVETWQRSAAECRMRGK